MFLALIQQSSSDALIRYEMEPLYTVAVYLKVQESGRGGGDNMGKGYYCLVLLV